ncbi:glucosyl transferase, partial [Streptococcus salivarius]|uniref:glucosyl transferase n=2 Tax=Streptococcus TaxID=1301 RepID=UPI00352E8147
METNNKVKHQTSKNYLIAFSCASALASFALIAGVAFADEVTTGETHKIDTTTSVIANVETTADLVETKGIEAISSAESSTGAPELASSENVRETASATTSESQAPTETTTVEAHAASTRDSVTSETTTTTPVINENVNITGGQYYSDQNGKWHYRDANGNDLTGPQTIDGVQVYFDKENGVQAKGVFAKDPNNAKKLNFYDKDSGALLKSQFIVAYSNDTKQYERYYLDDNGNPVYGEYRINRRSVYFDDKSGTQIIDRFAPNGHFYDQDGVFVNLGTNRFVEIKGKWYYLNNSGQIIKGSHIINGAQVYFDENGIQIKGDFDKENRYYDEHTGKLVTNRFVTVKDKNYFIGAKGIPVKGATLIDGKEYYFDNKTGAQVKGDFGGNGKYYDTSTGALVTNRYVNVDKYWYYVDAEGKPLKGSQTINNVPVYFDSYYGRQVKGDFGDDGYYYDKDSGVRITLEKNRYHNINNHWYYVGSNGKILKGDHVINGVQVHFDKVFGIQAKDDFVDEDGINVFYDNFVVFGTPVKYYDKDTGELVKGRYFTTRGKWFYADKQGNILKGAHTIDGVPVYFDDHLGTQFKNVVKNGHYYDKDTGEQKEVPRNQFVHVDNGLFYYDKDGKPLSDSQTINGVTYSFYEDGQARRGTFGPYGSGPFYDKVTGAAVREKGFHQVGPQWYYTDENGNKLLGLQKIDG